MLAFLDESGPFTNPQQHPEALSGVGALVLTEAAAAQLELDFPKLRQTWARPLAVEPKGRELAEQEIASTLRLLAAHNAKLWVSIVDMADNPSSVVQRHRRTNARYIIQGLGDQGVHRLRADIMDLAKATLRLPDQLYVQLVVSSDVLERAFRDATAHFSLVYPTTLGAISWTVDAKRHRSEGGDYWSSIISGWLQTRFAARPLMIVRQGDYSAFEAFTGREPRPPAHLAPYLTHPAEPFEYVDVGRVVRDAVTFVDSAHSIGLQLADICINAVVRAMKGHLRRDGWRHASGLLMRVPRGAIQLKMLSAEENEPENAGPVRERYGQVLAQLLAGAGTWLP